MKKYTFSTPLLSSLVHTEETSGNVANIYREKININNKVHNIPAVHGNAIRGVLRRVGFNRLCELLGLERNSLSVDMYHTLFNGGALTSSTGYLNLNTKREIRELLPLLSVFGSAMGNDMLPGKMIVSSGLPQCKELGTGEASYHDMTNIVRYTRLEDGDIELGENDKTSQMFYDIEVMIQGTTLQWEIILDYCSEIEEQAMNDTLMQFAQKPFLGGASGKGHGRLGFEFSDTNESYLGFIEENKEKIVLWLKK